MSPHTKNRVVGYVRVSTEEQSREGVSLEAQRARIEAQAVASGLELVAMHIDAGVSAKSLDRPALSAALADLDGGRADALLVFKLDRLTRNVADLGKLIETYFASRFALLSVSDSIDTRSAGGRLVLNVLTSVAQWEREAVGERTAMALRHLKSKGVHIGRVGLGQRHVEDVDPEGRHVIVVDPEGQATVGRIVALRRSGASLREICTVLDAEGRKTARGGRWQPGTVAKVLKRSGPQPVAA